MVVRPYWGILLGNKQGGGLIQVPVWMALKGMIQSEKKPVPKGYTVWFHLYVIREMVNS